MTQTVGTLTLDIIAQNDARLGRQMIHDSRSRAFVAPRAEVDRSTWHDRRLRVYDPRPNPNQVVGNCTMCAKAMQLNTVGNRVKGRVLDMDWATEGYRVVTRLDPFPGAWEPDDTGSSGLASCKAAIKMGVGADYVWEFGGADGIVQNLMEGRPMSVGTWWYGSMFTASAIYDGLPVLRPSGSRVGGHQYLVRGYDLKRDMVLARCWWGTTIRDFWMSRADLDALVRDGGDAHYQHTV